MGACQQDVDILAFAGRAKRQRLHVGDECEAVMTVQCCSDCAPPHYPFCDCGHLCVRLWNGRRDHEHTWLPAQLDAIDKVLPVQTIAVCSQPSSICVLLCLGRVRLRS
jgi:hypothetical protein